MKTKSTITLEKSIIERAKFYTKNTGRSLSELIVKNLDTITQEMRMKRFHQNSRKYLEQLNFLKILMKKKNYDLFGKSALMKKIFIDTNIIVELIACLKT